MRQLQSFAELLKSLDDRTLILIWTEDSQIYRAEIPNKTLADVNDETMNNAIGELVPNHHLFPPWSDTLTEAQQPLSSNVYVKKHYGSLRGYDGTDYPSKLFMTEVNALEIISKKPHPNVNKYLGCIRDGDAVVGICLEKHGYCLDKLVTGEIPADSAPPLQPDVIIAGIKAGIDHIHSLGLVHDDIKPSNIMVDSNGNPIIIDYDTCVAVGAPSRGGTPGWSQNPDVAAFENDFHGFDLVVKYIRGEYDGMNFDAHFDF